MENKKIGIATVYTGYNYGSALQAYATKEILNRMGYTAELLKLRGSLLPGRDVRLKKLLTIAARSLLHKGGTKNLQNYSTSIRKALSAETKDKCDAFTAEILQPKIVSYSALKKTAHSDAYTAFVCGSDQIWNAAVFYVDPFYYLQFAPVEKRIAFAPSFGRETIPDYNKKKIAKYVSQIPYKSVREASGADIVRELSGDTADVLLDPTLVLSAPEWTEKLNLHTLLEEKYLFAYFLDAPSERAVQAVLAISKKYGLQVIGLPYTFDNLPWKDAVVSAGPREFVAYVKNASFVCTDSFHGTAFCLNYKVPFYTFERNYGNASKQSARIESILNLVELPERYEPQNTANALNISFETANTILSYEREKSKQYLQTCLGQPQQTKITVLK